MPVSRPARSPAAPGLARRPRPHARAAGDGRSAELRLRRTLEAMGAAAWEWHLDAHAPRWSADMLALHGVSEITAGEPLSIDRWLERRVHPDDREGVRRAIAAARRGADYRADYRALWPDGSTRWIRSEGVVTPDARGRMALLVGVSRPIDGRAGDERASEQDALHRQAASVAGATEPEGAARLTAELAAQLCGGHRAVVAEFVDGRARTVGAWHVRPAGSVDDRPLRGDGALARVAATGRAQRIDDYASLAPDDPAARAARATGSRAAVAAPIHVMGRVWGAVLVAREGGPFPPAEEQRLVRLADLVGLAVAHAETGARLDGVATAGGPAPQTAGTTSAALRALARAVDAKDPSTREHSERVAALAVRIAAELGWPRARRRLLHEAALLHDVGKIGIPDAVLFKPGALSPAEVDLVRRHASLGAEIAEEVLTPEQADWIRRHHERPDGRGYPAGLSREQIPEGAQILAIADSWDVMTCTRTYKAPLDGAQALAEITRCAGAQFAPAVVRAMARVAPAPKDGD